MNPGAAEKYQGGSSGRQGQLNARMLTAPRGPCTKAPLLLMPGARLALGEVSAADGLSATKSAQEPPNLGSRSSPAKAAHQE